MLGGSVAVAQGERNWQPHYGHCWGQGLPSCHPSWDRQQGWGAHVPWYQFPITGLVPVAESIFFSLAGPRLLQAIPAMSLLGLSPSWEDCSFRVGRPLLPVWPRSWEEGGGGVRWSGCRWDGQQMVGVRRWDNPCSWDVSAHSPVLRLVCISPSVPSLERNKNKSLA